jgi:hypothetical protein
VTVAPYSYTVSATAAPTLAALLERALGSEIDVHLAASIAYGEEEAAASRAAAGASPSSLRVALFNAAATPEREAHGRFLASLAALPGATLAVIDEAALNARAVDATRRDARRALWQELAREARVPVVFTDLAQPDLAQAEADFDAAMNAAGAA